MRTTLGILFAALFLLVGGCATAKPKGAVLLPSMVSPRFKSMDAPKLNPFSKAPTQVDYLKVQLPAYDRFFADAATLQGTVVLADVVLKETDAFVAGVKRAGPKNLNPRTIAKLNEQKERTAELTDLLKAVPTQAQKLVKTGDALALSAPKTFIGPQAARLPAVLQGITNASGDVKNAVARTPAVLAHAERTTASLVSISP